MLAKGYGEDDRARHRAVEARRTLFRVGSVSKLFIWTAVMQLVERGKVDLDADVNRYLEGVEVPATFKEPVTLAHLMTHTAGFEDHVLGLFAHDATAVRPLRDLLAAELPARVRAPGVVAAYSNHGAALAMLVVEQVSGMPWTEYVETQILGSARHEAHHLPRSRCPTRSVTTCRSATASPTGSPRPPTSSTFRWRRRAR